MSLEGLLSELLVATILNGIHLKSVGVAIYVMVLGEKVTYGVKSGHNTSNHTNDESSVGHFAARQILEVLRDIMSHLRSRGGSSIFIFNHAIVELRRHSDNHMIIIGVVISALGNVQTKGWIVMIPSQQIVRVVDKTWLMRVGLGKLGRPHSVVGILCLMYGKVGSPHSVVDNSLPVVPLLEKVGSVLLMGWMNFGCELH